AVTVTDGTTTVGPFAGTNAGDGTWSIGSVDVSTLADGTITLSATGTDVPAGNTGLVDTKTALKDTVAPVVTVDVVTDPVNSSNRAATAASCLPTRRSSDLAVTVTDGTTTVGPFAGTNAGDGTWSIGSVDVST